MNIIICCIKVVKLKSLEGINKHVIINKYYSTVPKPVIDIFAIVSTGVVKIGSSSPEVPPFPNGIMMVGTSFGFLFIYTSGSGWEHPATDKTATNATAIQI